MPVWKIERRHNHDFSWDLLLEANQKKSLLHKDEHWTAPYTDVGAAVRHGTMPDCAWFLATLLISHVEISDPSVALDIHVGDERTHLVGSWYVGGTSLHKSIIVPVMKPLAVFATYETREHCAPAVKARIGLRCVFREIQ